MDNPDVAILSRDELAQWDALVTNSTCGTIFHTGKWITTCADLLGKREVIYGYYKNDKLIGGCSIYSGKKYHLLASAISNAPLTPYGGYVFESSVSSSVRKMEQNRNIVISAINGEMKKKFDHINLVNSPELSDIRPFLWNGWTSTVRYLYYLDLNDQIETNVSKGVRGNIRKAQKNDISIGMENDVDTYYSLLMKTYEKQGLPTPVSKHYISKMIDMILSIDSGKMWIARTSSGEPAAVEMVIWDNKRAYRWQGVLDPQFKSTGATSLLLYEIFKDLSGRGISGINLMAGNTPHLTEFVSAFNPRLVPYYRVWITKRARDLLKFW